MGRGASFLSQRSCPWLGDVSSTGRYLGLAEILGAARGGGIRAVNGYGFLHEREFDGYVAAKEQLETGNTG